MSMMARPLAPVALLNAARSWGMVHFFEDHCRFQDNQRFRLGAALDALAQNVHELSGVRSPCGQRIREPASMCRGHVRQIPAA